MTPAGVVRLQLDEACRLAAYPDPDSPLAKMCVAHKISIFDFHQLTEWESLLGNPWTVGYGQTGAGIGPNTLWTQAQADAALMQSIKSTETRLSNNLSWYPDLMATDPVRADVLCNIAFNIGVNGLMEWHHTLGYAQAKNWDACADEIASNAVWKSEVHDRCDRCADAMRSGSWG